jgi:hypothetical protein
MQPVGNVQTIRATKHPFINQSINQSIHLSVYPPSHPASQPFT